MIVKPKRPHGRLTGDNLPALMRQVIERMVEMKAFNINDKHVPFTDYILDGMKTVETRRSPSLHSLIGKRVGIIRTGKGRAMLVGYVTIVSCVRYDSEAEFRNDYDRHLVPHGSEYDIVPGGVKYGYILADPERCEPIPVTSKGIVIRNI